MSTAIKNTDIYLNALERSIQYQGIRKDISDSYWESDITPLIYPLWDSAKDKLEIFCIKSDGTYLITRNKYKKNFKDNTHSWVSYEFDPAGAPEYDVNELGKSIKEKFLEFKGVEENNYEKAIQIEYARTNSLTWNKIKVVRKFLLQDSDFVFMEDSPVSAADKELWKKYRAYIRDIPQLQQGAGTPFDIVFPITPDEYNRRKTLNVEALMTEVLGDQGVDAEYLSSSYHFWKMKENTLTSFAQRMAFYIVARTSTVEDATGSYTNNPYRVMVSPFHEQGAKIIHDGQTPRDIAEKWKADDDKVNRDYIESLLDAIEKGEM